jgi:hypothetical protein
MEMGINLYDFTMQAFDMGLPPEERGVAECLVVKWTYEVLRVVEYLNNVAVSGGDAHSWGVTEVPSPTRQRLMAGICAVSAGAGASGYPAIEPHPRGRHRQAVRVVPCPDGDQPGGCMGPPLPLRVLGARGTSAS